MLFNLLITMIELLLHRHLRLVKYQFRKYQQHHRFLLIHQSNDGIAFALSAGTSVRF